jgi:quercetin dioxygenase-like cupin family protein
MPEKISIINESSIPFRFENISGPKYIVRGPNVDFGLVRIPPGEDFKTHYHNQVEEIFYTLEGTCEIHIDKEMYLLKPGDLVQVPPLREHYLRNTGDAAWLGIFVKSPYDPKDKIDVDWLPEN